MKRGRDLKDFERDSKKDVNNTHTHIHIIYIIIITNIYSFKVCSCNNNMLKFKKNKEVCIIKY